VEVENKTKFKMKSKSISTMNDKKNVFTSLHPLRHDQGQNTVNRGKK
jgi:hypothetical protein